MQARRPSAGLFRFVASGPGKRDRTTSHRFRREFLDTRAPVVVLIVSVA